MPTDTPTVLAPNPAVDLPTWDVNGLLQRLGGDAALAVECVEIFCQDADVRLAHLAADLERGSVAQLARGCHSLKGAAGTAGAQVFELAAAAAERAALANDVPAVAAWIVTMRRELAQLPSAVAAFRAGQPSVAA